MKTQFNGFRPDLFVYAEIFIHRLKIKPFARKANKKTCPPKKTGFSQTNYWFLFLFLFNN